MIAQSQHEYLAGLKKSSATGPKNTDVPSATSSQGGQSKNDSAAAASSVADKGKSPMPKDRHI